MPRQRQRSIDQLQRDNTLPRGLYGDGDDERSRPMGRRMHAVEAVLCSLPDEQYERWKARIEEVGWFIPHHGLWGRVSQSPNKKIIYLNPFLEFVESDAAIVGLVVHEVAHFLLDHIGAELRYEEKEEEVNRTVRDWGFAEEADAADKALWSLFNQPERQGDSMP